MCAHAKASPDRKWYRLTSPVPVFHPSSFGHHVAAPREARTVGVRECLTARLRPRGLRRAPRFVLRTSRGCATRSPKGEAWWSQAGSNRRPLACHASALPAELWPLNSPHELTVCLGRRTGVTLNHSSGLISSLFVAADVANDVGDVLVAFFLVGDEGRVIIVIVFDGLVDFDVVFRFGNDGLDLAGVLLGIGLFQRDQFLGLSGLRHVGGRGRGRGGARRGFATGGAGRRNRRN